MAAKGSAGPTNRLEGRRKPKVFQPVSEHDFKPVSLQEARPRSFGARSGTVGSTSRSDNG